MAIEQIELELVHDNPYQARLTYHRQDIDDLAHSIKTHGLLQVPPGRRKDGNVELGFGHLRKRAFAKLAKKEPEEFGKMPIDIRALSDEQMAMFALEENLKRRGISPLETARAVDKYLNSFPGKTEIELAESLNMAKGTVSNMRRVLRLPEKILDKIDEGIISFHQGRDLLIFERFENAENLMRSALDGLKIGNKYFGEPNTVDGLQKSIHSVIKGQCQPLDQEWQGWRGDLLFDTRAAGCLECDKMIRTHPTKSATAHYCTDEECWKKKQEGHKEQAAAAARAKMEAEIINRAAQVIEEEKAPAPEPAAVAYMMEKRGTSWIAIDDQGRIIAINHDKKVAEEIAKASFEPVATIVNPGADEYRLNHTYRFVEYPGSRKLENFDVTAQDLTTAAEALGVDHVNIELVKVWKSSGKLGTAGSVSAGWSNCSETLDDFSEKVAIEGRRPLPVVANESGHALPVPCESCTKAETCDRTYFHVATDGSDRLVCEKKVQVAPEKVKLPTPEIIPEDILALAREKAGTRVEVLDLNDICSGSESWNRRVKQGYAILDDELRFFDDSAECLERCTHGFHFAFDSKAKEQKEIHVCSDTKCLANKKAAFTRAKNAEGQARKKAETKAVKEAIDLVGQVVRDGKQLLDEEGKFANTVVVPRATLKLILLSQVKGRHVSNYFYGQDKSPDKWLWDKVSAGTKEEKRNAEALFKAIDNWDDEELVRLVVDMMFYYLTDKGDIGIYEIKAVEPLKWLGVEIDIEEAANARQKEAASTR